MRRHELVKVLQTRPFRPFRMFVSDGGTFDVRHPEMLMVTQDSAIVGLQDNGGQRPGQDYPAIRRHTVVDLLHITRYEPLPQPKSRRGSAG